VTNGALDFRLLWNWLRDPVRPPREVGAPTIEDRLAGISAELAGVAAVIDPYLGEDLVTS
jgi:hypothetical protein